MKLIVYIYRKASLTTTTDNRGVVIGISRGACATVLLTFIEELTILIIREVQLTDSGDTAAVAQGTGWLLGSKDCFIVREDCFALDFADNITGVHSKYFVEKILRTLRRFCNQTQICAESGLTWAALCPVFTRRHG